MKRLLAAATLAMAAPGLIAMAQEPAPAPPRPPPVDQAKALAAAQRLIADAQAEGIFTPGADAGGPLVRHQRSKFVCHFEMGAPNNSVTVFDKGSDRGNDVGCSTRVRDIVVTMYANRVQDVGDVDRAEAGQIAAIKKNWPQVQPFKGQVAEINPPGAKIVAVRMEAEVNGRPVFTRAAAMRLGDWVITQRVTSPKEVALAGDMLGGVMLANLAIEAGKAP